MAAFTHHCLPLLALELATWEVYERENFKCSSSMDNRVTPLQGSVSVISAKCNKGGKHPENAPNSLDKPKLTQYEGYPIHISVAIKRKAVEIINVREKWIALRTQTSSHRKAPNLDLCRSHR